MNELRNRYSARVNKQGYFNIASCDSSVTATLMTDLTKCGQTFSTIVIGSNNNGLIDINPIMENTIRIDTRGSMERMEIAGLFRAIADCLEECDRMSEPK